eukprot:SAG31_NODE_352_length_17229_cov_9.658669_15_plen_183_part_00
MGRSNNVTAADQPEAAVQEHGIELRNPQQQQALSHLPASVTGDLLPRSVGLSRLRTAQDRRRRRRSGPTARDQRGRGWRRRPRGEVGREDLESARHGAARSAAMKRRRRRHCPSERYVGHPRGRPSEDSADPPRRPCADARLRRRARRREPQSMHAGMHSCTRTSRAGTSRVLSVCLIRAAD